MRAPPDTPPIVDLLVIGAGMAGLTAARLAQKAGYSVLVVDKGRRVGGRVATRRNDGFIFNHGAQFMTAQSADFRAMRDSAITAGMATNWHFDKAKTAFIGRPMMRQIPAFLADGLVIQQERRIAYISRAPDHISCIDTDHKAIKARQVICTAPAPQTALLLASDFPDLAATAASAIYAPCWTVMLGLEDDSTLPEMPVTAADDAIGWAMRETARPHCRDHRPALTIQADAAWSRAHINDSQDAVIAELLDKYQHATGCAIGPVLCADAHRWLYAKVIRPASHDAPICQNNVAIAGDWLGGARVEHAVTSGARAFSALTQPASSNC